MESSIESPAMPVAVARATLAATSAGAIAKPPSKSALTGTSTLSDDGSEMRERLIQRHAIVGRPSDQANPELVVARAANPRRASARALPDIPWVGDHEATRCVKPVERCCSDRDQMSR